MNKLYFVVILLLACSFSTNAQHSNDSVRVRNSNLIQSPYLQKGDTIAIVAPAGVLKNREKEIQKAAKLAKRWGLHVVFGKHMYNQGNHFAGTDAERAEDLQKAMDNPTIKAIWAARGGYGTVRILDRLDFTKFKESPKWVIGYSDITALHSHIHNLGFETIHGMMATSMIDSIQDIKKTVATFKKALFGKRLKYKVVANTHNRKGKASGQLVGGNLSILTSMLGSKSQMDTKGKILFIEEIGEYKYSIDRMLQSLKRAGFFTHCKGLIVGDISNIKNNTTKWGTSIEQLILDVVAEYDFPVLFDFPAGHEKDNRALIFGRSVEIDVKKKISYVSFKQ
ncbi:MAG: LD-carboxypeptidase [Flavobacteriaceae bacterium]|nr:LD-carboxypeptidase [Flavobacteriaceae bacterium]